MYISEYYEQEISRMLQNYHPIVESRIFVTDDQFVDFGHILRCPICHKLPSVIPEPQMIGVRIVQPNIPLGFVIKCETCDFDIFSRSPDVDIAVEKWNDKVLWWESFKKNDN